VSRGSPPKRERTCLEKEDKRVIGTRRGIPRFKMQEKQDKDCVITTTGMCRVTKKKNDSEKNGKERDYTKRGNAQRNEKEEYSPRAK